MVGFDSLPRFRHYEREANDGNGMNGWVDGEEVMVYKMLSLERQVPFKVDYRHSLVFWDTVK